MTSPPACCTATTPTPKPSPASPGASTEHALGVITGEVGAGKTVAVRAALADLDPTRHTVIYLPNPTIGARGIHHAIVTALGGTPDTTTPPSSPKPPTPSPPRTPNAAALPVLVDRRGPPARPRPARRHPDAHQPRHGPPVALRLPAVGQPTLRRKIKLGVLAALDQRIALRYTLPPMTPAETAGYIRHHLALAGRTDTLFSDDATDLIHHTSRGYPRAVNNLAIQALIAAFATDKAIVDESIDPNRRHRSHDRVSTTPHTDEHQPRPAPARRGFPHPTHPHHQRRLRPQRKRRGTPCPAAARMDDLLDRTSPQS